MAFSVLGNKCGERNA